jgi:hypothetical protein
MEIQSDGHFSRIIGADVQKRACGLRSPLLPSIFTVESTENRTEDDLQFPLFVGADCISFHATTVAPDLHTESLH